MIHLGDITKIKGADVPTVNVIIGGSPCQDLSIAGKRAGLAGERSGLFMEQLRIIKEMRKADEDKGKTGCNIRPRFMVWENVPGAFSSNKGADFATVLHETIRVVCKEAPAIPVPKNGWPTAGCINGGGLGNEWSIAWRVLDAQFWGVPQRRRRIALVADFGGNAAPEILFERKGLPGYYPQSGSAWKDATSGLTRGVREPNSSDGEALTLKNRSGCEGGGKGALVQIDKSATLSCNNDQYLFQPMKQAFAVENHPTDSLVKLAENGIVQTFTSRMGTGGGNTPLVMAKESCYCTQGNSIDRADTTGCNGKGWIEDVSYTLNTVDRPAVAYGLENDKKSVMAVDCRNFRKTEVNGTLQAKSNGGISLNTANAIRQQYVVRRLTPLECERLQGFPDGWTDIGTWVDENGKTHSESADSARYKALGNSIAIPPWFYVLQKLSLYCGLNNTMASLFDGIGGFPYIWETLNGINSCLWASEIEEFAIAVTKKHFPDEVKSDGKR